MSDDIDLGNLAITITDGEPAEAKFDLPNGTSITRTFPESGTINMRLGLGLSLSHQRPPAAEGGGEGAPEWVPEGAAIHIDLVGGTPQGRAWVEGVGEVAVDTLLGAGTINYTGVAEYNPALLEASGYMLAGTSVAVIGSAKDRMIAGSTFRIQTRNDDGPGGMLVLLGSNDSNEGIEFDFTGGVAINAISFGGTYNRTSDSVLSDTPPAINAIAATMTSTRAEFAVNGSGPYSDTLVEADWPTSGDSQIAGVELAFSKHLQSITVYDVLPSTAGLTALSVVA